MYNKNGPVINRVPNNVTTNAECRGIHTEIVPNLLCQFIVDSCNFGIRINAR